MSLLTPAQRAQLLANGKANAARNAAGMVELDFVPVVKLFTPDAGATWLLTELDPDDQDTAFGLCDLGLGCPELGYVSLAGSACRWSGTSISRRTGHSAPTLRWRTKREGSPPEAR
jgi:hypothetical protein